MNDFITLNPADFERPDLVIAAVEAYGHVTAALVNEMSLEEIAKIFRGMADVIDQQAAQNERGRNN